MKKQHAIQISMGSLAFLVLCCIAAGMFSMSLWTARLVGEAPVEIAPTPVTDEPDGEEMPTETSAPTLEPGLAPDPSEPQPVILRPDIPSEAVAKPSKPKPKEPPPKKVTNVPTPEELEQVIDEVEQNVEELRETQDVIEEQYDDVIQQQQRILEGLGVDSEDLKNAEQKMKKASQEGRDKIENLLDGL